MSLEVRWSRPAIRDMGRLDEITRERIRRALYRFIDEGHGDVRPLKGSDGEFRLRVGQYWLRFIYDHDPDQPTLTVLHVLPRDRAYRDFDD